MKNHIEFDSFDIVRQWCDYNGKYPAWEGVNKLRACFALICAALLSAIFPIFCYICHFWCWIQFFFYISIIREINDNRKGYTMREWVPLFWLDTFNEMTRQSEEQVKVWKRRSESV